MWKVLKDQKRKKHWISIDLETICESDKYILAA